MGRGGGPLSAVRRGALAVLCGAATGCSTEPSGSLTLALDPAPPITNTASVTLQGSVARTPPKTSQTVVRATGGLGNPVDTVRGGHFAIRVDLNPNAQNRISLIASDATGASSQPVAVTIQHDDQGPAVAQATPADTSDNVARTTPIQLKMGEAVVVASGGGIRVTRQGAAISGTTTLSADSLTLTFTPSAGLSPNAIYQITLSGVSDVANNAASPNFSPCFVTAITGAAATATFPDPTADFFRSEPPPALSVPDLVGARFAREGALFSGVFRFVGPRVFSNVASNLAAVFLELDTDQDSTTGFITLKDTLFNGSGPPFDTLTSGTRAEYIVGLEPHRDLGDSAYVGKYTLPLEFEVTGTFLPGVCGAVMGFVAPVSSIGNDDGRMNAVVMGLAASPNFLLYVDPIPTKGHLTLSLDAPAGTVAEADWPSAPRGVSHRVRPRLPPRLVR